MDLDQALDHFDTVYANLERLEKVWRQLEEMVPFGIQFFTGSQSEYEDLRRAYTDLLRGLPPVDGTTITAAPLALNEIAQERMDAHDVGLTEALVGVEEAISEPGEAIRDYRFRLGRARGKLVRPRAVELVREIERLVTVLEQRVPEDGSPWDDDDWVRLVDAVSEVERLVGPAVRRGRWTDLRRHLSFGQRVDLHDISSMDWPSVRPQIEDALYAEDEPLPVPAIDLGTLAATAPSGPVSTALAWDRLAPEDFERLIFNLVGGAEGYENAQWLTHTNAPDRGRDVSVERVVTDALTGVSRQRVILQCRHLRATSISATDAAASVAAMKLWEPPPVDVLVLATSGRFTSDAVDWIERHNQGSARLKVEMWPESHLESLLAQRPAIVVELGLRSPRSGG